MSHVLNPSRKMSTYLKMTQQMKLSTKFLVCLLYLSPVKFPNSLKWVKMI